MIELDRVSKRFGAHVALDGISLEIPAGRTTVLLGQSGCGKSTAIRLMVGLIEPDEGEVRFDGKPLGKQDLAAARHRMGYVIQSGGLFPHLTGRENATLLARELGWDDARCEARLVELARLVRLPRQFLDRWPDQLSGGQRQRVGLVRALFLDPAVLLLDEPLGALDPMIRADLQTDLRKIIRDLKKAVVLVTHDLGEAAYLGDEVVLLWDGTILQRGPIADLLHRPADERVTAFVNAQRTHLDGGAS
jgi:osmoprotectant transport system ATP-binding protein